jgi:two-component system, NarL family, sensor histidine kinase UhpB
MLEPSNRPLADDYTQILRDYLREGDETTLTRGYEMARRALQDGLGIVEITNMHHQALQQLCTKGGISRELLEKAGGFLAECLSPFEMSHRGAREGRRALRHLNEVMEAELQRIAHALHDEAGQLLALAHISLADIMHRLPPEARKSCGEIQQLLRQIEAELRTLSHELRPSVLDNLGLLPALEFLAEKFAKRTGLAVSVEGDSERRLPPRVETAMYRIVQEALNNTARHARAKKVMIELECSLAKVACSIRDDGVGFALREASGQGMGLSGIRERLTALGGSLRVVAEPGCGTTILTDIPLGG